MEKRVYLSKKHDRRIRGGHLWIFSNELTDIPKLEPGSVVEIFDSNKKSYGFGFYNPNSLIAVRILKTFDEINIDFFRKRLEKAFDLRKQIFRNDNMYRLVFGESDLLPGLIVDKYDDYLSIQSLSAGIEKNMDVIVQALIEIIPSNKGIILKNISHHRNNEGLELFEKIIFGSIPDEIICMENGISFSISLLESQKTGYYLDQKENRLFVKRIAKNKKVLDCYTNQGAFALNAAKSGAKEVVAVDVSGTALEKVRLNADINGFQNIIAVNSDVPDFLNSELEKNNKYDIIILDPPSFTKSKKTLNTAISGYKKINKLALKLLSPGGYLLSSSCTHYLQEDVFQDLISEEAIKQQKMLQLIYRGMQAPDHPVLLGMPETKYLKFFAFKLID
jgi:23S rRNA (cytosine1962-C5)-methyltransferase